MYLGIMQKIKKIDKKKGEVTLKLSEEECETIYGWHFDSQTLTGEGQNERLGLLFYELGKILEE